MFKLRIFSDKIPNVCKAALFLVILGAFTTSQAQIVLTQNEIPSAIGITNEFYINSGGTVTVDVGNEGGPQTWDFSEGPKADSVVESIVNKVNTPFADLFPDANLVYNTNALNIAGIDTASGFQYMRLGENGLDFLGAGSENILGFPLALAFDSSLITLPLPLEYGSLWSDSIVFLEVFEDLYENPSPNPLFPDPYLDVRVKIEFTTRGEVDAWGTVSVPHGEFETLRVRKVETTHLQFSVLLGFIFVPVFDSTFTVIRYDWYSEDLGTVVTVTSRPDETNPHFSDAILVRRLSRTYSTGQQMGDVNCDGSITPGDALCTFWRAILGFFQEVCSCETSEQAADVNCDGQITPGDALCIFWRSILGEWQEECRCTTGLTPLKEIPFDSSDKNYQENAITFNVSPPPEVTGCPGNTITVPITLIDPKTSIDAFSMDLSFPISLLSFNTIDVTGSMTEDWYIIAANEIEPGIVRIGGLTLSDTIESSGTLCTILFAVKDGAIGQDSLCLFNFTDDLEGVETSCGVFSSDNCPTSSLEEDFISSEILPATFQLSQNEPNPFNPTTTINYTLPEARSKMQETRQMTKDDGQESSLGSGLLPLVSLKIFNILGQEVRTLVDEIQEPGYYSVTWDGKDSFGNDVTSGMYFYRLAAGGYSEMKRMVLLK